MEGHGELGEHCAHHCGCAANGPHASLKATDAVLVVPVGLYGGVGFGLNPGEPLHYVTFKDVLVNVISVEGYSHGVSIVATRSDVMTPTDTRS